MIKIFSSDDTVFTSNGNKILEPISCLETKASDEWFLEVKCSLDYVSFIAQDAVISAPTKYGYQPFRVNNITIDNFIEFTAYHIGFDSKLFIIDSLTTSGLTALSCLNALLGATLDSSHFTAYSDITTTKSMVFAQCTLYDAISAVQAEYGGYVDFDGWQIRLTASLGADRGVTFETGKNLESVEVHEDWGEVCTTIYPVGTNNLTLTPKTLSSATQYDRPYMKVVKFDSDDETTLNNLALAYLSRFDTPKVNYKVEAIISDDLANSYDALSAYTHDQLSGFTYDELSTPSEMYFRLNDTIVVKSSQVNLTANILSYTYDILAERVKTVEFGNYIRTVRKAFSAINESIEEVKNRANELRTITAIQTELINNAGTYGYCIKTANEIYFVDTIPMEDATLVMRLNVAGLGFSSTGITGPYTNAWTLDGHLNADFISGLTITGVKIETTEDMEVGKILSMVKVVPTTVTELAQMRRGLYGIHFGETNKTYDGYPTPVYPWGYITAIDRATLSGLTDPLIEIIIGANGALRLQTAGLDFAGSTLSDSPTALDRYEEGTFTPVIKGLLTPGIGAYSAQTGYYTRVGNMVTVWLYVQVDTHTGTGSMIIDGLPFTCSFHASLAPSFPSTLSRTYDMITARVPSAQTYVILESSVAGGTLTPIAIDTSFGLILSGSYMVA